MMALEGVDRQSNQRHIKERNSWAPTQEPHAYLTLASHHAHLPALPWTPRLYPEPVGLLLWTSRPTCLPGTCDLSARYL